MSREEQHVQNHDSSGKPEREEAQHTVQRKLLISKVVIQWNKFDLANDDDTNIDFSVSGIPEEVVETFRNL